MTKLNAIPGIGSSSLELLEAAGFADVESLARAKVDHLADELEKANRILRIASENPGRSHVEQWISSAREIAGMPEQVPQEAPKPVNYELRPEVAPMLDTAPFAIPLPAKLLMENQIPVSEIPPAILFNRYSGDLEVRFEDRAPAIRPGRPPAVVTNHVQSTDLVAASKLDIDTTRVKGTEVLSGPRPRSKSLRPESPAPVDEARQDRVALIRAPREGTNKGKNPNSRWYIRGVLHTHPWSMALGAVVTLLLMLLLPTAIVSAALLLLSQEMPQHFSWVPQWLLAFPLALPVVGIIYLIWGLNGSCRICGQRQFWPRMCLKNSKAHHVPGLGYIVPVAVHMLIFRWFRCTYCGTPVRLKK